VTKFKYFATKVANQNFNREIVVADCIRGMLATIQVTFIFPPPYNFICFIWMWNLMSNHKGEPRVRVLKIIFGPK